jgi:hypothetical protein
VRRRFHHRAQVGREGEERTRHGLRRPVAGQESVVAHPPGRDHRFAQQRQDHVPSAEHERTRTIERLHHGDRLGSGEAAQQRETEEKSEERRQRGHAHSA